MQATAQQPQRAPDGAPLHYERHRPEQTTLYCLVQQPAASFIAHTQASTGAELPRFIKDEFDAFLDTAAAIASDARWPLPTATRRTSWFAPSPKHYPWTAKLPAEHKICSALADHDRRRIGVARYQRRHHRRVGDAQTFDAAHAQLRVDHGSGIAAHAAGAHRVVHGHCGGTDPLQQCSVVVRCGARVGFGFDQR